MDASRTLSIDQVDALLEELEIRQGTANQIRKGTRNLCMAIVMLETGLRVAELCGLIISDLWFAGQPVDTLVVRKKIAKNNKERHIPISVKLSETIKLMESDLWPGFSQSCPSYAFFGKLPNKPLTTRTVERIILEAGKNACNREVTPHMLRHTFASKMMKKTNARVVQSLLGHDSLQSTQIYMHPDMDDLKKAINS
jgi:integrase/recombinase XerC